MKILNEALTSFELLKVEGNDNYLNEDRNTQISATHRGMRL
jgi:hypothetical protein